MGATMLVLGMVLVAEGKGNPSAGIGGVHMGAIVLVLSLVLVMEGEGGAGVGSAWGQMGGSTMLMLCLVLIVVVEGKGDPRGGVLDAIVLILNLVQSNDDTRGGRVPLEGGTIRGKGGRWLEGCRARIAGAVHCHRRCHQRRHHSKMKKRLGRKRLLLSVVYLGVVYTKVILVVWIMIASPCCCLW